MEEHMGSVIKRVVKEKGISSREFAGLIHVHYKTVRNIYKRKYFKTEQLIKITVSLEYDFVSHIYKDKDLVEFKYKKEVTATNLIQQLTDEIASKAALIEEQKRTIEIERKMYEIIVSTK